MTISSIAQPETTPHPQSPDQLVTHLANTVLATAAAVDVLSGRVDVLAQQLQQQDCQIFALSEDVKAAGEQQQACLDRVDRLTRILEVAAQNLMTTLPLSETVQELSL